MLEWVARTSLMQRAESLVRPAAIVMDIGCGIRPQTIINNPNVLVCVEAHDEYLRILRERFAGTNTILIQGCVPACLTLLPDGCVDTIFMLDFIEHLTREDGLAAIHECQRLARQQVVLFTPLGFMPQAASGEMDGWGLQGVRWQMHRSGWEPSDFSDEWHVIACRDFHASNGNGEPFDPPFGALWAIFNADTGASPGNATADLGGSVDISASGLREREAVVLGKEIALRKLEQTLRAKERLLQRYKVGDRFGRFLARLRRSFKAVVDQQLQDVSKGVS